MAVCYSGLSSALVGAHVGAAGQRVNSQHHDASTVNSGPFVMLIAMETTTAAWTAVSATSASSCSDSESGMPPALAERDKACAQQAILSSDFKF